MRYSWVSKDTCFFPLFHATSSCCQYTSVLIFLTWSPPDRNSVSQAPSLLTRINSYKYFKILKVKLSDEKKIRKQKSKAFIPHKKFQAHFPRKLVEVPPVKLVFTEHQRIIFQRKPRRAEIFS